MTPPTTLTTAPPDAPPPLHCPDCDNHLQYLRSYLSGTRRQQEQWDVFQCSTRCGTFEYRHRTRRLRPLAAEEIDATRFKKS